VPPIFARATDTRRNHSSHSREDKTGGRIDTGEAKIAKIRISTNASITRTGLLSEVVPVSETGG